MQLRVTVFTLVAFAVISFPQEARASMDPSRPQAFLLETSRSPHASVTPLPIGAARMENGFWSRWMEANRANGLPALLKQLEDHGVVDNFRIVSGKKEGERRGPYFTDSDLFKWMEGAAWTLAWSDDPALRKALDEIIDEVVAVQREDGYLNTFFVGDIAGERFRNLGSEHELYCAGHMFQAAIAHFRATGQRKFLDCATRYADFLVRTFGPGKIEEADGHPEIELALVELYRTTGSRDYLDLARFFLTQQNLGRSGQIEGHAVRAAYLFSGVADLVAETGSRSAAQAVRELWDDVASARVYITGGLGGRAEGEKIGGRYELPNEKSYAETCAAIANVMWNLRMLGISGDPKYADMMETALYNGVLAGVSLSTSEWFYVNPMAWTGMDISLSKQHLRHRDYQRSPWHGTTCCPTNMVRLLASLPGYMYGFSDDGVWVHFYDSSSLEWVVGTGTRVAISQRSDYPFGGNVEIDVDPVEPANFALYLRVPGWCRKASAEINGSPVPGVKTGYLKLEREWKEGDRVRLTFEMNAEFMVADPRVRDARGRVALQRGPLVYCLESIDNPGAFIPEVAVDPDQKVRAIPRPDLLEGVTTLALKGSQLEDPDQPRPLYRPVGEPESPTKELDLVAIPYYAWSNRGSSQMAVWINAED